LSKTMVHEIEFRKVINTWDEAIPLGNGLTGSLIWGDGSPLRISLDRGDLWDTRLAPEWNDKDCTYAELIRLVQADDHESIVKRFEAPYTNHVFPTKIPAGRIELDFGEACRALQGGFRSWMRLHTSKCSLRTAILILPASCMPQTATGGYPLRVFYRR